MQILTSSTSNQSALMDYSGYYFDGADNFNTWRSNSYAQRRDIFEPTMGNLLESLEPLLVHCIIVSKVVEPESHQISLCLFFKHNYLCNVPLA